MLSQVTRLTGFQILVETPYARTNTFPQLKYHHLWGATPSDDRDDYYDFATLVGLTVTKSRYTLRLYTTWYIDDS